MKRASIYTFITMALLGAVVLVAPRTAAGDGTAPKPQPGDDVRTAAREIDRLVAVDLARAGLHPNGMTDDATFVRRVYLDVVGRIPTAEEARAFLDSNSPTKRRELIDVLLGSKGFVSHMYNFWSDLFRVKTRLNQALSGEPYIHWLKDSVAANKHYDVMVRELINASGAAYENGATGYHLRDRGMPEDNMANSLRLFLGTRLECAQCHDHPFDKWTQKQFFEMAAFTGGMQYRTDFRNSPGGRKLAQAARKLRNENQQAYGIVRRQIFRALGQGVSGSGAGVALLPEDYQYDDASPNQPIAAKTIFGEAADVETSLPRIPERARRRARNPERMRRFIMERLPERGSREAFANWLTSPENPRFTTVIANRMWKRVMGRGLIEPVDDFNDQTEPVNPALMDHLESVMRSVDYDLTAFLRVLLNTQTYQRESTPGDLGENEAYHFPGPLMRRMSAEEMWDSLMTMALPDVDATVEVMSARAKAVYGLYERLVTLTPDELARQIDEIAMAENPRQAFRRISGSGRRQLEAKARPLYRRLRRAQRDGDEEAVARIRAELEQEGLDPETLRRRRRGESGLARASEIESPAPPGHLLRQLGQSDKEQIEGGHGDANVPQILSLLNGYVDSLLLSNGAAPIMRAARATRRDGDAIESVYLSVLARPPTKAELSVWKQDFRKDADVALNDLVWTLTNSHEFRFRR